MLDKLLDVENVQPEHPKYCCWPPLFARCFADICRISFDGFLLVVKSCHLLPISACECWLHDVACHVFWQRSENYANVLAVFWCLPCQHIWDGVGANKGFFLLRFDRSCSHIWGGGGGGPITYFFSCVLKESLVATRHPLNLNFHTQLAKCSWCEARGCAGGSTWSIVRVFPEKQNTCKFMDESQKVNIWVWVKIGYPNNWMIKSKDRLNMTKICGSLNFDPYPYILFPKISFREGDYLPAGMFLLL